MLDTSCCHCIMCVCVFGLKLAVLNSRSPLFIIVHFSSVCLCVCKNSILCYLHSNDAQAIRYALCHALPHPPSLGMFGSSNSLADSYMQIFRCAYDNSEKLVGNINVFKTTTENNGNDRTKTFHCNHHTPEEKNTSQNSETNACMHTHTHAQIQCSLSRHSRQNCRRIFRIFGVSRLP